MTQITHAENRRTMAAEIKKQTGWTTSWRRGGHWAAAAALLLLLAGAANAALFAVALLANEDPALRAKLEEFRAEQTAAARAMTLPPVAA